MNENQKFQTHLLYLKADKWLHCNGQFTRTILEEAYEVGFRLSFEIEGDSEPTVVEGQDLIALTIQLHADVS